MTAKIDRCALPIRQANVSSRARQERGVQEDTTNVTNVGASGPSRFTCATTQTESGTWRFHKCIIQTNLFLWKFLQAEALCLAPWFQAGFSVLSVDHEKQWSCGPTSDVGLNFQQWSEGSLGNFVSRQM